MQTPQASCHLNCYRVLCKLSLSSLEESLGNNWVPFGSDTINNLYNLPKVDNEAYETLRNEPNYLEIIKILTKNQ